MTEAPGLIISFRFRALTLRQVCRTPPEPSRRLIGPGMPNISPHRQPILVPSLIVASFKTRK